jgi:hypothetical protein
MCKGTPRCQATYATAAAIAVYAVASPLLQFVRQHNNPMLTAAAAAAIVVCVAASLPLQFVRQHNKPPAAGDLRTRPNPYVDLFAGGTAGGGAAAAAAGKAVFGKAAQQQQQPAGGFGTGGRQVSYSAM